MADKKISALPLFSGSVAEDDLFAIVDTSTSTTKRIPISAMAFPYFILLDNGSPQHKWKLQVDSTGALYTTDLGAV